MEQLTDNREGSYTYVDDLNEAQKLFVETLTSTLRVIALDTKIQVDFKPDEVAYYLVGKIQTNPLQVFRKTYNS